VGRRGRKRRDEAGKADEQAEDTDYTDADGNVLKLRDGLSRGALRQLEKLHASARASQDDVWQRRGEYLFERLVLSWTIAGLPLEGQKELLGRFRMADSDTRRWVRDTLERHLSERHPDAAA
jgi:hypothetical protein